MIEKYRELFKDSDVMDLLQEEKDKLSDKYCLCIGNSNILKEDGLFDMIQVFDVIDNDYSVSKALIEDLYQLFSFKCEDDFKLGDNNIFEYVEGFDSFINENKDKLDKADIIMLNDFTQIGLISYIKNNNPEAKIILKMGLDVYGWYKYLKNREELKFMENLVNECDLVLTIDKRYKLDFLKTKVRPVSGAYDVFSDCCASFNEKMVNELTLTEVSGKKISFKDDNYILSISDFSKISGIEKVYEAYKSCKLKGVKLVIAIREPVENEIFFNLDSAKKMLDFLIEDEDVLVYDCSNGLNLNFLLRFSNLVIQFEKTGYFNTNLLYAGEVGTTIICSRCSANNRIVTDSRDGFLIKSNETSDLAGHILGYFEDETGFGFMRHKIRTSVRNKFSYPVVAYNLLNCINLIDGIKKMRLNNV